MIKKSVLYFVGSMLLGFMNLFFFSYGLEYNNICLYLSFILFVFIILLNFLLIKECLKVFKRHLFSTSCILFFLIIMTFMLSGLFLSEYGAYRLRKSISLNLEINLRKIASFLESYSADNKNLPDASAWCSVLINKTNATLDIFRIGQLPNIECNFAFNRSLSSLEISEIKNLHNCVLLFESDCTLDSSGDSELLTHEYYKNRFSGFFHKTEINILFTNGKIAKYRPYDNEIALGQQYTGSMRFIEFTGIEFSDWLCESETDLLPLRWEVGN